ncbi:hypothetical protein Anae109_4003 [Anaeromyxobacter sp. Fw109-5]|nr:hypothetical protein Anae109_4003 [Anaeromyxobacter sp. Fw109-5]
MASPKTPEHYLTRLTTQLEKLGLSVQREPALGGMVPDLAFRTEDGKLGVIEFKNWEPTVDTSARALHLTQAYRELAGADSAVVIVPRDVKIGTPGLVGPGAVNDWLVKFVEEATATTRAPTARDYRTGARVAPSDRPIGRPRVAAAAAKKVLAIMPFEKKYDDTYLVAMAPAAKAIGTGCRRVDKEDYVGDVMKRVEERIRSAAAVIADLSESRPNVLYELGFAHGAGVKAVLICSTPIGKLPFDVRNQNVIEYRRGQTFELQEKLRARLIAVLSER